MCLVQNPVKITTTDLAAICGFDPAQQVVDAKETKEQVLHNAWKFWALGEYDENNMFYGHIWAYNPDGTRYILTDTYYSR